MPASETATLDPPLRRLRAAIREEVQDRAESFVRVGIPVEPLDALTWLRAQPWPHRLFWSGRGDAVDVAGAGVADFVEAASHDDLENVLGARLESAGEDIRYFGYARFDGSAIESMEWQPFGRTRFVLPRVELRADGGEAALAVNICPGESSAEVVRLVEAISWEGETGVGRPLDPTGREDEPSEERWAEAVQDALRRIRRGELGKVVLARRSSFLFRDPVDPFLLLARLRLVSNDSFHVLFSPKAGTAFLSASPERLFRVRGRRFASEAVAGTEVEGTGVPLHDEKNLREQAFVMDAVRDALAPVARTISVDGAPSRFPQAGGCHLRSRLEGTLRDDASAFDLLRALHPTPAVAGTPTPLAIDLIAAREAFDRGLYAGPIGWIARDAGEFAVGIRSGLVEGNRLRLYSGAGIVEGSDPEAEWAEVEQKLAGFRRAFDLPS